jgi:hypothetical protein
MPASSEPGLGPAAEQSPTGSRLAITAEALYLANLLVVPLIPFLVLGVLFLRCDEDTPALARAHVDQAFSASLWAGILLVIVNAAILLLGGYRGVHTWTLVILHFTVCHSTLVLLGIVGLAKAMAGQCWRFPLVGRSLPRGCSGSGADG